MDLEIENLDTGQVTYLTRGAGHVVQLGYAARALACP